MEFEQAERPFKQQNAQHESKLSDLNTNIEQKQRKRNLIFRQTQLGQAAGEAKTVQQAKGESDNPGMTNGKAGFTTPAPHDLRAKEQNRERDCGIQRSRRDVGDAKRSHGEGDTVRHGKGGYRLHQHPSVLDDKE